MPISAPSAFVCLKWYHNGVLQSNGILSVTGRPLESGIEGDGTKLQFCIPGKKCKFAVMDC
jgi:hypothetical protein